MNELIEGKDYTIFNGVLTINEGVTYIPENRFRGRKTITSVVFPSTLISIKSDAFNCCALEGTIIIPDTVKYIHDFAFNSNLINKVIIGSNVIYIGEFAFYSNPLSLVMNKSDKLKEVGRNAFTKDQSSNHMITRFELLPIYEKNVSCGYKDKDRYTYKNGVLNIHEGVEEITDFRSLKDCIRIEMPDTVAIISSMAFDQLTKLKTIKFSNNLIDVSNKAFSGCKSISQKIVFPDSLCYLESDAFDGVYLQDKISVSYNTCISVRSASERKNYEVRDWFIGNINNNDLKYVFDINKLMEEEKLLLEKLNLLPYQIEDNKILNKNITERQSIIMKKALISFIVSEDYNEEVNIFYIEGLLKLKEIEVSDFDEVINYLFEKKQKKTIYLFMSYGYDFMSNSMIRKAILNNLVDMVEVLLLLGVDINEMCISETTPLSTACIIGNFKIVKHLIEKGAAINITDSENKRAIDYAVENNHQDIVDLLNSFNDEKSDTESDLEDIKKQLRLVD